MTKDINCELILTGAFADDGQYVYFCPFAFERR
jgi:hypothetical protein